MTATRTPVVRSDFAPGRWIGRVTAFLIAGFFAVFFVLPLVWLLLAPTKDKPVVKPRRDAWDEPDSPGPSWQTV